MDRGLISTTISTCKATVDYIYLKCAGAIGVMTYSFFFGDIEKLILTSVVSLVIMDMFTGVIASYKTGKDIQSKKFLNTAIKLFVYTMLISAGHMTENIIGLDFKIDEIITFAIATTEFISIVENMARMGFKPARRILNQLDNFRSKK